MNKNFTRLFSGICLSMMLGSFLFAPSVLAAPELIKVNGFDTVYYLDSKGVRHAFPNLATYQSWYGNDFSKIVNLSAATVAQYPLGSNITVRQGTKLLKVPSAPEVYAVEQGGVLRKIQNEDIAQSIYGSTWAKRVIDLPEVFFANYKIGADIRHDYTIPEGILYQDKETQKYYYYNNGILRELVDSQAISLNRFNLADVIVGTRSYAIRERPITGLDKNVFNPVAPSLEDRRDCEAKNLKAAFLFLANGSFEPAEIESLQKIKQDAGPYFSWAAKQFSNLDLNYPTAIQLADDYILKERTDGTYEARNELINTFYDNNADIFDFIFIFTNFAVPKESPNEIAYFVPVTNITEGLNKALADRSEIYGSTGKLKGVIMMGNIDQYNVDTQVGLNRALNIVTHEILHHWGAYIEFTDANGEKSKDLLRAEDQAHWSNYLTSLSPLGGFGWIDNGDGTFTNGLSIMPDTNLRQMTNLDLYLMGLIPQQLMGSVFYIKPNDPENISNTIAGQKVEVTVDQIINASGKIKCSLN